MKPARLLLLNCYGGTKRSHFLKPRSRRLMRGDSDVVPYIRTSLRTCLPPRYGNTSDAVSGSAQTGEIRDNFLDMLIRSDAPPFRQIAWWNSALGALPNIIACIREIAPQKVP